MVVGMEIRTQDYRGMIITNQLQKQQKAITDQNKALQNTTTELTEQNNTIVQQQQQQQAQIQYIQLMIQAIANQYPNIQLPTKAPIIQQANLANTSLQQAAGNNTNNATGNNNTSGNNNNNMNQNNNGTTPKVNDIRME